MKKIILIAICFVSLNLSAQGNLQFNQVINQTFTGTISSPSSLFGTITVPAGKVWKIEAATYFSDPGNNKNAVLPASYYNAWIDNYLIWDGTNANGAYNILPLWLKPGTYEVRGKGSTTQSGGISISAIEFNVVP